MKYAQIGCDEFVNAAFSKAAVPGGGGVSALAAALGTALGGMVCNLTAGKKKYAMYEEDIARITAEAEALKNEFMAMIDADAENFLPLSKAYGLPSNTEEEKAAKAQTLESCLKIACQVPMDIVRASYKAIKLQEELAEKGSSLAISDVGCGVVLLRAAIQGGWLNVLINIGMIKDEAYVAAAKAELIPMMNEGVAICDTVYQKVQERLTK